MNKNYVIFILVLSFFVFACKEDSSSESSDTVGTIHLMIWTDNSSYAFLRPLPMILKQVLIENTWGGKHEEGVYKYQRIR